jgi:hypothetical protein
MFATEIAEALVMMAQAQGLTVKVDVSGATVFATLANGGCFRVSIAARAGGPVMLPAGPMPQTAAGSARRRT